MRRLGNTDQCFLLHLRLDSSHRELLTYGRAWTSCRRCARFRGFASSNAGRCRRCATRWLFLSRLLSDCRHRWNCRRLLLDRCGRGGWCGILFLRLWCVQLRRRVSVCYRSEQWISLSQKKMYKAGEYILVQPFLFRVFLSKACAVVSLFFEKLKKRK